MNFPLTLRNAENVLVVENITEFRNNKKWSDRVADYFSNGMTQQKNV